MQIEFVEQGDSVEFRISRFDHKYASVLRSLFYESDGDSFVKIFPRHLATEQVQQNFSRYARAMLDQIGGFTPVPWQQALAEFARRAEASAISWWLTGSGALAARGIAVAPHDLDIMLRSEDLPRIESALADCIVEPVIATTGWVMKRFGVAFLEARLDLAFDPEASVDRPRPADFGPYALEHLETIRWRGFALRVPPAALHLDSNRQRGRFDRVALIEEYLATQNA